MSDDFYEKLEKARDVLKTLLRWAVVSVLSFAYWLFLLLLISLFLLNIWKVEFNDLLHYSIVLAVITAIVYAVYLIRSEVQENKKYKRLKGE